MIWTGILANPDISEETDFFKAGAGSMDVARLVAAFCIWIEAWLYMQRVYY